MSRSLAVFVTEVLTLSSQRAGMTGTAFTFFTTDNAKAARELVGILREAKANVPPELDEMTMFGGGGGRSMSNYLISIYT